MCFQKRFHILSNIDEKTLEELTAFLKGSIKVYLLLGVVYFIFSVVYFTSQNRDYAILGLFQSLLYFAYSGSSYFLTSHGTPSVQKLIFSSTSLFLLMIFTIIAVLYKFTVKGQDYSVFIDLMSVLFQCSTQFIYYKCGIKIKQKECSSDAPQAGLVNNAV